MSFLTGGSKSKQQSTSNSTQMSGNLAYPYLKDQYDGTIQTGNSAGSAVGKLLGLDMQGGYDPGKAFQSYLGDAGFNQQLADGGSAITSNLAAKGLLGSGKTLKSLNSYQTGLTNQYYGDYVQKLMALLGSGISAGGVVSGAGNTSVGQSTSQSTGTSSSTNGIAQLIAAGASMASDRRVKTDVNLVGSLGPLNVYEYRYLWDEPDTVRTGLMAQEVEELYPEAVTEVFDGMKTVDYGKLREVIDA